MVNSLLQATSGHDRLRVWAAAVWLVNNHKKSLDYRRNLHRHLVDHITGFEALPDHIVKLLVDALHPSLGFVSALEMTRLLKIYVERDSLPSHNLIHSILFNLYERHQEYSESPAHRGYTAMYYIAHLLEKDEDRPLCLCLIRRMTSSYGPESVIDADLTRGIFHLLDLTANLYETQTLDILNTISHSPTSCYADDRPLQRLGKLYELSDSERISRAAIVSIVSFMESVFRTYYPLSDSFEFDVVKETQAVVHSVSSKLFHFLNACVDDKEITSFSIYVFSLATSHVKNALDLVPTEALLRTLMKFLYIPNSYGGIPIIHHVLQVIRSIVVANRSVRSVLAESMSAWVQLATDNDPLIRWPSSEILVFGLVHVRRDERMRVFETVWADISRRLQSTASKPFVDPNWKTLTGVLSSSIGSREPPPAVALAQEVMDDLRQSGIVELLDGVSRAMICEKSTLIPEDFYWLPPLHTKAC